MPKLITLKHKGERETTAQRGYGARWQRERLDFLSQPWNQFCVKCKARGLLNPGTMRLDGTLETNRRRVGLRVDHIVPHKGDQRLFWNQDNWQPLCADDHDIVKQREEHGQQTGAVDISGRPVGAHPWNR